VVHDAQQYIPSPDPDLFAGQFKTMFWLVLEAGVALAVLLLIVWWTWPRAPRDEDDVDSRK
jgi:hypothetical protein